MYGCESWTIKKAEHWRTDAFELWCWGRLLRAPWTARRSNQSILKEINPEYSLERLMLKLQYFDHLMQRVDSLEKILTLGKIEDRRRRGRQRMRWLAPLIQWTWVLASSRIWWRTGKPRVLQSMGWQRVRHDWVTEKQQKTYSRILKIKPSYSSQYPILRYHLKSLYSWHLSFLVSLFPYFSVHSLPTPFFSLFPSNSSLWPLEWPFHSQQTFLHTQHSHNLLTPAIFPWLSVTSILLTPFSLVSHITDKNCIGGSDDSDCCQIITWY